MDMNDGADEQPTGSKRRFAAPVAIVATLMMGIGGSLMLTGGGSGDDAVATVDAAPAETTTTIPSDGDDQAQSAVFVNPTGSTVPPVVTRAPVTTSPRTTLRPTTTSTTSTTLPPVVAETLPDQPEQPIAPPADPRGAEEQIQLGAIRIPKLGVDEPLLEGIRLTTLDNGPGHWPGTAMPGEVGNVVVAAHRTSHGAPFRNIDQLVAGDIVQFETAAGVIDYTVTKTHVVNPDDVWIVDPTATPTATLFACHPPGSVRQRIVVNLELKD